MGSHEASQGSNGNEAFTGLQLPAADDLCTARRVPRRLEPEVYAAGRKIVNFVPLPTSLFRWIAPFTAFTRRFTMERPRPVP